MKQSQLFTKTQKFAPKDEVSKNAQLLIRAGYIHKEMAGAYTFLPLGWRVMQNIMNIIREELDSIGAQEMFLTGLQDPQVWKKTDRWSSDAVDVWFKTALQSGTEIGLGFTHEEPITRAMAPHVNSHKDLPFHAYQFQTKFRNEVRAKSGIMRGREFIMKDAYTFCRDGAQHEEIYAQYAAAYERIFTRLGIGENTFKTFASGGSFTKYSHEFQTICDAGEDTIYVSRDKGIAINEEVYNDDVIADLGLNKDELEKVTAAEVGNIFSLGTRFAEALGLTYRDENEEAQHVVMGSYGIGPGRVMGVIAELFGDEAGLVWPEAVAPFAVHLIDIGQAEEAEKIYSALTAQGVAVLWDDRDKRPGEKFAESDLLGMPTRVVVSGKSLEAGGVEVKKRTESEGRIVSVEEFLTERTPS